MRTIRFSDGRVLSTLASLGLLFGMITPALITSFASAAEVTTRSIDMSTSASSATSAGDGVSYNVTFTPAANAAGYIIDFCSNTSIPGESCTAPTGLSTAGIGSSTSGATPTAIAGDSAAKVVFAMTGGSPAVVELTGITNPSTVGTFYARIITYSTSGDMTGITSNNSTTNTGEVDSGGVALATSNEVGVSAAVLETMTFCVSGTDTSVSTDDNCINTGSTLTSPSLILGQTNGGVTALTSGAVSTGTIYTQLSTNAQHGAVVTMKSDATNCGGLLLNHDTSTCYIGPATAGITAGQAKFGVETGTAVPTTSDSNATGTYEIAGGSGYSAGAYKMNFTSGNTAGVTGPYGDPILDTNSLPVNDENMPLTFGASIAANTPAGEYAANLSLIATGTF
jgi:hypothetical protein